MFIALFITDPGKGDRGRTENSLQRMTTRTVTTIKTRERETWVRHGQGGVPDQPVPRRAATPMERYETIINHEKI